MKLEGRVSLCEEGRGAGAEKSREDGCEHRLHGIQVLTAPLRPCSLSLLNEVIGAPMSTRTGALFELHGSIKVSSLWMCSAPQGVSSGHSSSLSCLFGLGFVLDDVEPIQTRAEFIRRRSARNAEPPRGGFWGDACTDILVRNQGCPVCSRDQRTRRREFSRGFSRIFSL